MPRKLSKSALTSVLAQQTSEVWLQLLTIIAPEERVLVRLVNNSEDITSRGNVYVAASWELFLPPSDPDRLPEARIRVNANNAELIVHLRSLNEGFITLIHEIILASSPDVIEVGPINYKLKNVQYTQNTIEGVLGFENTLLQTFPKDTFVPSKFPGLFQ